MKDAPFFEELRLSKNKLATQARCPAPTRHCILLVFTSGLGVHIVMDTRTLRLSRGMQDAPYFAGLRFDLTQKVFVVVLHKTTPPQIHQVIL